MFRIQLAWASENNILTDDLRQFVTTTLPRAIATADGFPYKADKCTILPVYKSRYPEAFQSGFCISDFDTLIFDAMFLIYSPPPRGSKTFSDYINAFYLRNISTYLEQGIKSIHMVFDNQDLHTVTPKVVERSRRDLDGSERPVSSVSLQGESILSRDWQTFLKIRENKKALVNLLCQELIKIHKNKRSNKSLVISGGFESSEIAVLVSCNEEKTVSQLNSNIDERDSRVWLHTFSDCGNKLLVVSKDNDTYHIGLPLISKYNTKTIFMALDKEF